MLAHNVPEPRTKPSFYSLAPNALSVRPNQGKAHAIHTLQGSFGTAEGRETTTTTPETSPEVNTGHTEPALRMQSRVFTP